jgi:hypothetical protein
MDITLLPTSWQSLPYIAEGIGVKEQKASNPLNSSYPTTRLL